LQIERRSRALKGALNLEFIAILARLNAWQKIGPLIMETIRSCPSYRLLLARYLQLHPICKERVALSSLLASLFELTRQLLVCDAILI
jgi:hypothetical protein